MTNENMAEVVVEVSCILERFPVSFTKKIPKDFIDFINSMKSSTYTFMYDESKSLNEQNIKPETKGAIAYIYENFCCTDKEKERYTKKCREFEQKKEEEKRIVYNPDDIFKNKLEESSIENNLEISENNTNTILIEYEESFFERFKNFIFKLLHINK